MLLDRARRRSQEGDLHPPAQRSTTLEEYVDGFERRFGTRDVRLENAIGGAPLFHVEGLLFRETGYQHPGKAFKNAPNLRHLWVLSVMEVKGNPDRPLRPRADAVNDLDDLARLIAREPELVFDADVVLALLADRVKLKAMPAQTEGYYHF